MIALQRDNIRFVCLEPDQNLQLHELGWVFQGQIQVLQGSQRHGKSWKTWKMKKCIFQTWKNHGI